MPVESNGVIVAVAAIAGALAREAGRIIHPRKTKRDLAGEERARLDAEWARLDDEKRCLLAEIRDELDECRRRSEELEGLVRAERLRTGILIRAMQEHGIPVPDVAMLDVDFDAATGVWKLRDVA